MNTNEAINVNEIADAEEEEPMFTEHEYAILCNVIDRAMYGKYDLWTDEQLRPIQDKLKTFWVTTYFQNEWKVRNKKEKIVCLFDPLFTQEETMIMSHLIGKDLDFGLWRKKDLVNIEQLIRGYWQIVLYPPIKRQNEEKKLEKRRLRLEKKAQKTAG